MRPSSRVAALLASPLALLLVVGVIIPGAVFLAYSFFTFRLRQIRPGFSITSYLNALGNQAYGTFAVNTLAIAVPVTVLSVLGGFALAHHIVFASRRPQLLLALVAISMLGSYLARIYAWRTVLGSNGVINGALQAIGVIDQPIKALPFSRFAVIIGEVNLLLPLVCLLIYAGLAGIGEGVRESARDLGAGRFEILWRIILPMSGPAVLAATAFAFFLSCGDYITPVLLGGLDSTTIGVTISDQLRVTGNYALGSALGVLTLIGFGIAYGVVRLCFSFAGWLPRIPEPTA